jgi:diaminopimelate epimerase
MMPLAFTKMHGLGNDFVILDARPAPLTVSVADAVAIGDRRTGVGFDQLLIMEPPVSAETDLFLRILNPDGSEAEACGNGTRCVAAREMAATGRQTLSIETVAGVLATRRAADGSVRVDMGVASWEWHQIPLTREVDTLHLGIDAGSLHDPVAINMGNPHMVFMVDDADAIDLDTLGPVLEHHPLYPHRTNVEVVSRLGPDRLRMRVWERGAGITRACGSGACAAAVAACLRGLGGRKAEVVLDGGPLDIEWRRDGHVFMSGPVATSFQGVLDPALLGG